MEQVYYKKGETKVTIYQLQTARKAYCIENIEKIYLRRPLFWFSVPLAVAFYHLRQFYGLYLYDYEHWVCIAMFTVVPLIAWFISTLNVTSKCLTSDTVMSGFRPTLKELKKATQQAINDANNRSRPITGRYYADMVDE
ncbi:hypothetical protein QSV34_10530 [Porticoccus sp. W117]|uniref:hypothetical protein n=1 Tax=Porticoccus sp. W117 TaxID=3054777 RepID=UPI00259871E6|nr:hypothetical protein [Porticoccus sp. W117]MDM3871786.1 hypothetical protein [Porticoccus sp. W117]